MATTSINVNERQKSRSGGQALFLCFSFSRCPPWPWYWVHSGLASPEPLHSPAASGRGCAVEESEAAGAWVVAFGNRCLGGVGVPPLGAPPPVAPPPTWDGTAPVPPPGLELAGPARSFKAACGKRRACFAPSDAAEVGASPLRRRGDCWEGRRDGGGGTGSLLRVRVKRGGSRNLSRSRARAGGVGPRGPIWPGDWPLGRPRGGVVVGAGCGRTRPACWEGARSSVAEGGSSAFSGEGSAGRHAGLWGGVIVGAAWWGLRRSRDLKLL